MPINQLNLMLSIENVLSVYRNVTTYKKFKSKLVWLHISIQLAMIIGNVVYKAQTADSIKYGAETLYFFGTLLNSTVIILLSCIHSKNMKNLVTNLNANDFSLKCTKVKHEYTFAILNSIAIFICAMKLAIRLYNYLVRSTGPNLVTFFFLMHVTICNFRTTVEYFIMCSIFCKMSQQLKCITRSIDELTARLKMNKDPGPRINVGDEMSKFILWNMTYIRINETSKLFNQIFSVQLTVMIGTMTVTHITFLYALTAENVMGTMSVTSSLTHTLLMVTFLLILVVLSVTANRPQKDAEILRQRLSKLLLHSLAYEDCYYRHTKDLLRLVSARPIRLQVFGSTDVNMSLLPTFVTFFTSYAVVALQINNVV